MIARLFYLLPLLVGASKVKAASDFWSVSPSNNNWSNGGNWILGLVPNGTGEVATFVTSSIHTPRLSADIDLDSIVFAAGGDAFTIDTNGNALRFFGAGVADSSSHTQTLLTGMPGSIISFNNQASANDVRITAEGGTTTFHDSSTASSARITTSFELFSGSHHPGILRFTDTATAANATISNTLSFGDGEPLTQFTDSSTAANAQITNAAAGASVVSVGGRTTFLNNSKAGNATITNEGADTANAVSNGGMTSFLDSSRAQNATIINGGASGESNGGITEFANDSSANSAMITNQGNSATQLSLGLALAARTNFVNNATAANATISNNGATGDFALGGLLAFAGNATAANAVITNHAGQIGHQSAGGGVTSFAGNSTAANATIDNNAPASVDAGGGETDFKGSSTAGNATITNHGAFSNSTFVSFSLTAFSDTSDAGSSTIDNHAGGIVTFSDTATALNATITNTSNSSAPVSATGFEDDSRAGSAVITNNAFGELLFHNTSRAGTASITNNNNGETTFRQSSTAANASITTNSGGNVQFLDSSSGGTATFVTNGGGSFDISSLATSGTTAGSIAGAGTYFLGSKSLTVGSDNSSTQVSGLIRDGGGGGGAGGSLTKTGNGSLELTHANTYTGGTVISDGRLLANNTTGSATGSGPVTVQSGARLAGNGAVSGAVTVQAGGHIAPGESVGTLRTGNLSLTPSAEFNVELDPRNVQGNGPADLLIVTGSVNLGLGDLVLTLRSAPLPGEHFTILDNDGVDSIVGLFAQGTQVSDTFGGQTYSFFIDYHADADGGANDIVLTSEVPEPSPATLALFGLGIALICRLGQPPTR